MFAKGFGPWSRLIGLASFAVLLIGCAGTSVSWLRSNQTKQFDKGPYYAGKVPTNSNKIGHLHITLDERMHSAAVTFKKEHFTSLVEAMNQFLVSWKVTTELPGIEMPIAQAPDIYVGNVSGFHAPTKRQVSEETRYMILHTVDPSSTFRKGLEEITASANVDVVVFITLGLSEYLPRQRNLLGSKVLDLGTGNSRSLPWLSDLESPAEVLHVTGALLDRFGNIWRAGSEGIVARPTRFGASLLGVQESFTQNNIAKVLNDERREDLPGNPLKWQVALQNLVGQLVQRTDLMVTSN